MAIALSMFLLCCAPAHAQEWAKAQLEKSNRHLEWVDVKNDDRNIKCFIAYPEVKEKATAVLVIHEIFGLSDWVRLVCDQLAAEGLIAIAPDLLSGKPGEQTSNHKSVDDTRKAVSSLPRDQVAKDLTAVSKYVSLLPAANGKVAVTGFCWGGTQTWLAMTTNSDLQSGYVFYGTLANDMDVEKIAAPVYGFYGEKDARVTSTVDDTTERMKKASKQFSSRIYENAGHGFMRTAESPEGSEADKKARAEAWAEITKALKSL